MSVTAVDSHLHILDRAFPQSEGSNYVPESSQFGSADRFLSVLDAHGLSHGLLVAAEPYGFDNGCMLDAIARSDGRFKGVALVDPSLSDTELEQLVAGGVVGIRYNLTSFGMTQFLHPATAGLFGRLAEQGLFLQIHCQHDELVDAMPVLDHPDLKVMIDHFGRPDVRKGLHQRGFQAMLELGRRGNAVVKLSGPFRCSRQMPPYADVEPYVEAAIEAFTIENCVWGSDWPFVRSSERIDYGPELACARRWFPDDSDYDKIMAKNPARLFGFV